MKTFTAYAVKPAAVALAAVLATGAIATSAQASAPSNTETVSITEYADWGDPAMAKIAVDSGRSLMAHLSTARALLDTGQIAEARSALIASREFADTIERIMPYLTVVADMKDASNKIIEEDATTFTADLLPIYARLDELQVYAPKVAKRTRGRMHLAEKYAMGGDRKHAAQQLIEAADDIIQHTVYLPVDYVDAQVYGALHALDQDKPDVATAKAAVNRALDSVTTVVNEVVTTAHR